MIIGTDHGVNKKPSEPFRKITLRQCFYDHEAVTNPNFH
ncbi:conserved hypothetical protein [delta proteobacterium NaphS2]|nr:conserved hypothetical protein [delta proteobacterium NaphS2]